MKKKSIVFVCYGNICRSPIGEFICRQRLKEAGLDKEWKTFSRGFNPTTVGWDTDPRSQEQLRIHNIPFTHHSAKLLTSEEAYNSDYILLMDRNNLASFRAKFPLAPKGRVKLLSSLYGEAKDIADPWYTGDFGKAYEEISQGVTALIKILS